MKNIVFIPIAFFILQSCASDNSNPPRHYQSSYELTGPNGKDTINLMVNDLKEGIWIVKKKLGYKKYKVVYEDSTIWKADEIIKTDTFYYKNGQPVKKS